LNTISSLKSCSHTYEEAVQQNVKFAHNFIKKTFYASKDKLVISAILALVE